MDGLSAKAGIDSQHGAALLLVIGEPLTDGHKQLILADVTKGFNSWDCAGTGVDINDELSQVANRAELGDEGPHGERIIRQSSDSLYVEILVNPQAQTLTLAIKNFLATPTKHKHLIYAGHAFQGSGTWILQDDTFTLENLAQNFRDSDVESSLKQADSTLTIVTASEGEWTNGQINKSDFSKQLKVTLNPSEKLETNHGVLQFTAYVGNFVRVRNLNELMQSTDVVGNIRFNRPTLYIFPGCEGDSALFGISGFNLLVNGGYSRKACFWDFTRHLDRIDAALITHLGEDNLYGISSVLKRKSIENVTPEIGYLFMNVPEKLRAITDGTSTPKEEGNKETLLVNLADEGSKMVEYAKQIGQVPQLCTRSMTCQTIEPVNLFQKVGIGSLDMYILNPVSDSKELKEFYQHWSQKAASFGSQQSFSLPNHLSVCALLVWRPTNPNDSITRIFFPGNAPQHKIFEGLEKMKTLDILKHSKCSKASVSVKPVAPKKTGGVAARPPPSRAKLAPAPKVEPPPKREPIHKPEPRTAPKPRPPSAPKAKKEDVTKKTLTKVADKPKSPEKARSSTSSSPSKASVKSVTPTTPKQLISPVKEPEPIQAPIVPLESLQAPLVPKPAAEVTPAPAVNGTGSSVDPVVPLSEPLQPVKVDDVQPKDLDIPAPLPAPVEHKAEPSNNAQLDKNQLLEAGIYDDDEEMELGFQTGPKEPQMFGGFAASMHEDLMGNEMPGTMQQDLMGGLPASMTESFHEQQTFSDQAFGQNMLVNNILTPEDEESEEILPQALPEPQAYAPSTYSQEPDVIPSMPLKEEVAEHEPSQSIQEPDLLPTKPDTVDISTLSVEDLSTTPIDQKSTVPIDKFEHAAGSGNEPVAQIETPEEVDPILEDDSFWAAVQDKDEVQEKDITEQTAPPAVVDEGTSVDAEVVDIEDNRHPFSASPEPIPTVSVDEPTPEKIYDEKSASVSPVPQGVTVDDYSDTESPAINDRYPSFSPEPAPLMAEEPVLHTEQKSPSLSPIPQGVTDDHSDAESPAFNERSPSFSPEHAPLTSEEPILHTEQKSPSVSPIPQGEPMEDYSDSESRESDVPPVDMPKNEVNEPHKSLQTFEPQTVEDRLSISPEPLSQEEPQPDDQKYSESPLSHEPLENIDDRLSASPQPIAQEVAMEPIDQSYSESPEPMSQEENGHVTYDDRLSQSPEPDHVQPQADMESSQEADVIEMPGTCEPTEKDSFEQPGYIQEPFTELPKDVVEHAFDECKKTSEHTEQFESPDVINQPMEQKPDVVEHVQEERKDVTRDSLERDMEPDPLPDHHEEGQRGSMERDEEDEDSDSEEEEDDSEEDSEEGSTSFEVEDQASDQKCLIQDSVSEDHGVPSQTANVTDPGSPSGYMDSHGVDSQPSDNILTPESEGIDHSHGGANYQAIGDQDEAECDGHVKNVPRQQPPVDPYGQPGMYPTEPSTNPFDIMDQPGFNAFTGAHQQSPLQPQSQTNPYEDSSSEDELGPSGGPTDFDPLSQWGRPMGLPSPPPPEAKADDKKSPKDQAKVSSRLAEPKRVEAKKVPASKTKPAPPKASNGVPEKSKSRLSTGGPGAQSTRVSTGGQTGASARLSMGGKTAAKPRPASAPVKDKPAPKLDLKSKMNGTRRPATTTGSRVSPAKTKLPPLPPFTPFYVDLTYIPNHGNLQYSDVEFFKRIRARYYVLSAMSPNPQILDALLEAKKTWEDEETAVTIIPTYDNEALRAWMTLHKEKLASLKVEVAPAASRCTIQLQDHETSSLAYRLEF